MIKKQVISPYINLTWLSWWLEGVGVPGENPRGLEGDDLTFPNMTPGLEHRTHWW